MSNEIAQKKQTIAFTETGHAKLKEMSKRYGLNQWMMLDVMIETVDEQATEFKEAVKKWEIVRGKSSTISPKVASSISELTSGMSEEEVLELLKKARELK